MAGPPLHYPHSATLWRVLGRDEWQTILYSGPIQLKVRWDDVAKLFSDPSGDESVSKSIVAIEHPTQPMAVGDYLFFGVSQAAAPVEGADVVRQFTDVDSIDGRWTRRRAFL